MDATDRVRLLADPTRAALVRLITNAPEGRASVTRLARDLGLTQPTVSHHLRALADSGVVDRTPEGRLAWYSVAGDYHDELVELLRVPDGPATAGVLERIADDLATRFAGTFNRPTVARYVKESHDLLADGARVTRYLPSLTARFAADRLAALARSRGSAAPGIPEVLFVCVENAGRSQMAAAILRQLAGDRVRVRTAGSNPARAVRQTVVAALDEIGVPIGGEFPKPLTDEVVRSADVVVTMGCGDACPVYPGRRYLDWDLDDPAAVPLARVRQIRDDIDGRVRGLLAELAVTAA